MRKYAIALVLGVSLIFTIGCSSDSYKDGKYRVEYLSPDDKGWNAFAEVTVEDGIINDVVFDYFDVDGNLKQESAFYNNLMLGKVGTNPDLFCKELELDLIIKQNVADIDSISGATHSVEDFKFLVDKLIDERVKSGNTDLLKIDPKSEH